MRRAEELHVAQPALSRALSELDQGQHGVHDAAGLARGSVAVAASYFQTGLGDG